MDLHSRAQLARGLHKATVDWFGNQRLPSAGPHDARHNPVQRAIYSFGTQEAMEAERVPVA